MTTMKYTIKLVHYCNPSEALQLGIKKIPGAIRETAQKYDKSGDFEVMVLNFFMLWLL